MAWPLLISIGTNVALLAFAAWCWRHGTAPCTVCAQLAADALSDGRIEVDGARMPPPNDSRWSVREKTVLYTRNGVERSAKEEMLELGDFSVSTRGKDLYIGSTCVRTEAATRYAKQVIAAYWQRLADKAMHS